VIDAEDTPEALRSRPWRDAGRSPRDRDPDMVKLRLDMGV
jgi:hypothetical protein